MLQNHRSSSSFRKSCAYITATGLVTVWKQIRDVLCYGKLIGLDLVRLQRSYKLTWFFFVSTHIQLFLVIFPPEADSNYNI